MNLTFSDNVDKVAISGILGLCAVVASLMYFAAVLDAYKKEQQVKLMELCLETGETFEECRFLVFGGLRIARNNPTSSTNTDITE